MHYAIFLHLKAQPAWLALSRAKRAAIAEPALEGAFGGATRFRYFDAEAFHARVSDVLFVETDDPAQYYFGIERLRDSLLLSHPYFEIVEIVASIEEGYRAFEAAQARDAA